MKKLILGLIVIAALASCKKERICTCTAGIGPSIEFKYNDTKKKAKDACEAKEADMKKVSSDATCMLK